MFGTANGGVSMLRGLSFIPDPFKEAKGLEAHT